MFFAPSLQPMSHSPQSRQVDRGSPCTLPYAGVGIGVPGTGASCGRPAKVTASGGSCQSRPSRAALSRMAVVLAVAGYGYGVAPSICSTRS